MPDWSAQQYLKFEDERTRPARDLLAHVPLVEVRCAYDLGCGPGNSTELLVERYRGARVVGIDSSKDMLRQARERLPQCEFIEADLADWTPAESVNLLFANATYQWIPNHLSVLTRAAEALPPGGVLAVQMPDNTHEPSHLAMDKVAKRFGLAQGNRADLPHPEAYYDALKPLCRRVDIWHTIYNHPMANAAAITEWFRGSALLPFLAQLSAEQVPGFISEYIAEIEPHYPRRADGQVVLRFPRLFFVATR